MLVCSVVETENTRTWWPVLPQVNQPERRKKTPWVVSFAHKGWYMQPGVNFSFIDDLAHKYGIDLHIAGHIHTYQVCYSLCSRTTWIDDVFPQLTRMHAAAFLPVAQLAARTQPISPKQPAGRCGL